MIRAGRSEGWLKQPIDVLPKWAKFHGITFNGIAIAPVPGFEERGSAVIANHGFEGRKLMMVPKELIISRQNIDTCAKADQHLRQVLDAVGDFGRTTRGAVLIFLLMQVTICCPQVQDIGLVNPLTEYIKYLPDELLPTFWNEEEQELLSGTTLRPAVRAKLSSLLREYEAVRTATETIDWCTKYWWDEAKGKLTFEDWMQVDSMYRSRALEFPGIGDCMVPCLDMANHASGDGTVALYETDDHGNALLLLREGKTIGNDEITITYGDEKGACEYIFSYGFLESTMTSARVLFLDIDMPDDDPLRPAKLFVSDAAPGCRIYEKDGHVHWESDFIWLVVVNEEDGVGFKIRQTIDGQREIQALWKDRELNDTSKLRNYLKEDASWPIFQLRAIVLLQNRIGNQVEMLQATGDAEPTPGIRNTPWELARRLRVLEYELLKRAEEELEAQKSILLQDATVQRYLGLSSDTGEQGEAPDEDFT